MCFLNFFCCCCCHRRHLQIEEITTTKNQRCEVGEAPHWDEKTKSLFYVDIPRAEIIRYDSRKNRIYKAKIKDNNLPISFIIPVKGRKCEFVVSIGRSVCVVDWNGKSVEASIVQVLTEVDHDRDGNRCNDGKVDPSGKFLYFGTMGDELKFDLRVKRVGSFYRYSDKRGTTSFLKGDIGISNGLAWDVKRRKFYYIDSMTRNIKEFTFEPVTSEISNESVLLDFDQTHKFIDFIADGMTIDTKGNLYIAAFGAARIIVVDPIRKKVSYEIQMPTQQVTSLAFGGRKMRTLYVTTADKNQNLQGSAGGLFKITGLHSQGLPMSKFIRN